MDADDVVTVNDDLVALAFRLNWPTPKSTSAQPPISGGRSGGDKPSLASRLVPSALRRRLNEAASSRALTGWPVVLSVPSPQSEAPRAPSVKLTGRPLD